MSVLGDGGEIIHTLRDPDVGGLRRVFYGVALPEPIVVIRHGHGLCDIIVIGGIDRETGETR